MGIGEEVFEGFFKKLEEDEEFPQPIIKELRDLWETEEVISQEEILEAIKRECEDVSED